MYTVHLFLQKCLCKMKFTVAFFIFTHSSSPSTKPPPFILTRLHIAPQQVL